MRYQIDGLIRNFFSEAGDADYLASFVGTQTVTGITITTPFSADDAIVRINITDPIACPADADGTGEVNVGDLVAVILNWGQTDSFADLNGDGIVNVMDLIMVIEGWGDC